MENKISAKVIIKGRVQGVFFRAHTQKAALDCGLTGYVKNLPDGSVEALFQGSQDQVDKMIAWCYVGSPASVVSDVVKKKITGQIDFNTFDIQY